MSEEAVAAEEPKLDGAAFASLKDEGWDATRSEPTRAEIHADVAEKLAAKPYYWQHVTRKVGPQWLCSTDIDQLMEWVHLCESDPGAAEKAGLDFRKDPLEAVAALWVKDVSVVSKAQQVADEKVP